MYNHIFKNKIISTPTNHKSLSILFGSSSMLYTTSLINNDDEKFFKLIMGSIALAYFGKSTYHFMKFIKK
jgi:hypothetical protein